MMTEKEKILTILKSRGIIKEDGSFDHIRFNKLITEPWIYQKVKYYNIGETPVQDEPKTIDPVYVPEDTIQEDSQVVDNKLDTSDPELLEPVEKEEVQEEVSPIENTDETEDKKEITEIPVEPVSVEIDTPVIADSIESEPETKTEKKTAAKKSAKKA